MTYPPIGAILKNRYKILDVLGTGGMSTVYLATDQQVGDVRAIKVINAQMLQEVIWLERFRREGLILQRLRNPHVVTVYETDSVGDCHFMVMEYVRGKTITAWLQETGAFPVTRALDVAHQVALGLQAIHEHQVINRDIKSLNIMETADGLVKIIDFGIAKSLILPDLTGPTNGIPGTLYYVSPEQLRRQPLDIRTDIYSLGVVLYEMLAGRLPFDMPNAAEVIDHILRYPPPDLRQFNPAIPTEVAQLVYCCLAKGPEQRFQTPTDLIRAIEALLLTRPVCLMVEGTGQTFPVQAAQVVVGRRSDRSGVYPDVDLAAVDPGKQVSRRHARLFFRHPCWHIREEPGVLNGTFVNERRLLAGEATPLRDGDRIRLGTVTLTFRTW